jgi:hypothetical protein
LGICRGDAAASADYCFAGSNYQVIFQRITRRR